MKKAVMYIIGVGMSLSVLTACNNASGKKEEAIAKQMEVKRYNDSLKLDSFNRAEAAKAALAEEKKTINQSQPATRSSNVSQGSTATQDVSNNTATASQQKKGWSDAAKGGVIGGAAGAGVGALIDKKKPVRGAVIGAAVGGGSGYAIGRKSDRKSGRVQKK